MPELHAPAVLSEFQTLKSQATEYRINTMDFADDDVSLHYVNS